MPYSLILLFCLLATVLSAQGPDAAQQAMKLARHRIVAAKFVQIRHLAELEMDVEARGAMVSELDGRLRWQVDTPVRSVTVIDREKLTHFDGETGTAAVIGRKQFPWLKLLRDSLDDWLSGDPERLAKRFEVTFPKPRTLHLVPRDADLKKLCPSVDITLSPDGGAISSIRIAEDGGDTLEIRFSEVVNNPELSSDIWRMPRR